MAKTIEPTPVLRGKDAARLLKSVYHPVSSPKKESIFRACDATYLKLAQK